MALAHDAASAGERISAEAYTQFADHYFRVHQAAVGVAETKRPDQASVAAAAELGSGKSAADEAVSTNTASDSSGLVALEPAVDSDDGAAATSTRRSGRSNGRAADKGATVPDTASQPSV